MSTMSSESFFGDPFDSSLPITKGKKGNKTPQQIGKSFLDKDALTELGQGPIKKTPLRKEKQKTSLSPETEEEIRKIFGSENKI